MTDQINETDVTVAGNHVRVADGSMWPLPDLRDDGLAWRLTCGVALSSAETARAASIIRAYSHLTAEATVAKRSIVVRGIRAALALVIPPGKES